MKNNLQVNLVKNKRNRKSVAQELFAGWQGAGFKPVTAKPKCDGYLIFLNGLLYIQSKLQGKPKDGKVTAFQTPTRNKVKQQAQRAGMVPYLGLAHRANNDDICLVIVPIASLENNFVYVTNKRRDEKKFRHSMPWNSENFTRLAALPGAMHQRITSGMASWIDKNGDLR